MTKDNRVSRPQAGESARMVPTDSEKAEAGNKKPFKQPADAGSTVKPYVSTEGEIQINFDGGSAKEPAKKKEKADGGKKKEKRLGGLFGSGKKKQAEASQVYGAPAEFENKEYQRRETVVVSPVQREPVAELPDDDSVTVLEGAKSSGAPSLVYVGNKPNMPQKIEVAFSAYKRFTIGRFDVTVGTKQSDFEFDKGTRGVSRKHAVIEEKGGECTITDLQSSAGTYVDGSRLAPGEARVLTRDCRVSFGYDGADYVWKC